MPYAANALIDGVGWRFAYAIMAVATTALLAIFMPAVQAPPVDRVVAAPVHLSAKPGFQDGRLSPVTLLSAAAFLCCACMGVPLVHLTSFVTAVCGSSDVGSLSLLVAMLFGAVGRIAFGFLADRAGNLAAYAFASFIQTACVAIFPALDQQLSLLALSAVFGFGFAGNMTCLILCVRQLAPAERFGQSLGIVMLIAWVGMGVAGYFGGFVFDSFGSYGPAFVVSFAAGAANLVVLGVLAASSVARAQVPCGRLPDPATSR
jgi:predicted MFS family arabinose efflux permease